MSSAPSITRSAPIAAAPLLTSGRGAARMLGISERSLWAVTEPRGPLKAVRIGGRVLYRQTALTEYVVELEAHPPAPAKRPRSAK